MDEPLSFLEVLPTLCASLVFVAVGWHIRRECGWRAVSFLRYRLGMLPLPTREPLAYDREADLQREFNDVALRGYYFGLGAGLAGAFLLVMGSLLPGWVFVRFLLWCVAIVTAAQILRRAWKKGSELLASGQLRRLRRTYLHGAPSEED